MRGTVKWFKDDKGYGFIMPEDGTKDIFLHRTALESAGIPQLVGGEKLEFDAEFSRNGKGYHAVNIKLVS